MEKTEPEQHDTKKYRKANGGGYPSEMSTKREMLKNSLTTQCFFGNPGPIQSRLRLGGKTYYYKFFLHITYFLCFTQQLVEPEILLSTPKHRILHYVLSLTVTVLLVNDFFYNSLENMMSIIFSILYIAMH